jgi:NitT/TauT family transport system ATP-binding protein
MRPGTSLAAVERERGRAPAARNSAVLLEGVRHAFRGTKAVDNVTIDITEGEFCSIVGPSGCGKTTCLNIVAGEIPVQQGHVSVLGEPPRLGRMDIAYMFARDALLPWRSALDNVAIGLEARRVSRGERRERATELLASVGLGDYLDAYPSQLSHGMRQRVAIARTFAVNPSLLLMDEPFAALDAQTRLLLEDTLIRLWETQRSTVLFVTHDLAEAIALSDRIVLMSARPGRVKRVFDVPIARPRSVRKLQGAPEYHEIYEAIWTDLEEEVEKL